MGIFRRATTAVRAVSHRLGRPETFQVGDSSGVGAFGGGMGRGGAGSAAATWGYYDGVGEFWYASNFIGNCLSRIVLRPGWLGDDDEPGPLYDDDGNLSPDVDIDPALAAVATRLVRSLRSVPGGQAALLGAMGQNLAVAADCYVLGTEVVRDGRGYARNFEALSSDELRPRPGAPLDDDSALAATRFVRRRTPGRPDEDLPPDAFVLRVWRSHPRYRAWANSGARALVPTLEALRLLTLEQLSQSRSRLSGRGVYWIDEDIDIPPDPDSPEMEPFTAQAIRTMAAAIGDPGSAAANVPIVMRAPRESIKDGVRHDTFGLSDMKTEERRAAKVLDFARGTLLPLEVTTGQGAANHWGAWMIDESTSKAHIAPVMDDIVGHLTTGYFQPSLAIEAARAEAAAGRAPVDLDILARMVVWYDDGNLVVHPNREPGVMWAVGTERSPNFIVSMSSARRYLGLRESDRPDDDEIEERIRRSQLLNVRQTEQGLVPESADTGPGVSDQDPSTAPPPADQGPPPDGMPDPGSDGNGSNGTGVLAARLAVAADYAADRAVRRVCSRLFDRARRRPDFAALLASVGPADVSTVAARLGPEVVASLIPTDDLFAGEWATFETKAACWAHAVHHPDPPLVAARARGMVERLARERLYRPTVELPETEVARMLGG